MRYWRVVVVVTILAIVAVLITVRPWRPLNAVQARTRFVELVGLTGETNHRERRKLLRLAFPMGSLEADANEALASASELITDRKRIDNYIAMLGNQSDSAEFKEAEACYRWSAQDGRDGSDIFVFVGDYPRVILGVRTLAYDW